MAKFLAREKFSTIREAEIEADSLYEAIEIASKPKNQHELFPETAQTYVETEHDACGKDDDGFDVMMATGSTNNWCWEVECSDTEASGFERAEARIIQHFVGKTSQVA